MKTLGLCSDHAGYELKEFVKQILDSKGLAYKDFGTDSTESCDYPDYAHPLAKAVEAGKVYPGIAICGSGNAIAMPLNKHQGIRAALCWQEEIARLAREHNDANVLAMGGRVVGPGLAIKIVETFLNTPFSGEERHERRIHLIEHEGENE